MPILVIILIQVESLQETGDGGCLEFAHIFNNWCGIS